MTRQQLDLKYIQDEITKLLLAHPELDEDEILRADMVEGSTNAFAFISDVVRKIGATKALAAGTEQYIDELRQRKDRLERREYALRALIFKVMSSADIRKAELPEATVSIKQGQAKVVITNEHEIPAEFMRIRKEPDKSRIRAALTAHEFVPGAVLSNPEPVLAIMVK